MPISFLQSQEWQEIQERMGRKTQRIASALIIRHELPLGFHYLYCPRPPFLSDEFFIQASELAEKTGAIFIKIDPTNPSLEIRNSKLEIRNAHSLQPASALLIDCHMDEGRLLAQMHPKTRYNIRLAERQGVLVRPLPREEASARFGEALLLLKETAERERFSLHPEAYYRLLPAVHSDDFQNELWIAGLGGEILAAAIVNWYRPARAATYLHGASSRVRREVMAPHLLHWRIIQEARRRGLAHYDFGGIDEERWPGVTRFKRGFGGAIITYPASRDIVYRKFPYFLYRLSRRARGRHLISWILLRQQ